jgi:hypothetical protein
MKYYLLLIFSFLLTTSCQRSKTVLYDAPKQEKESDDFEMFVNEKPVFIYQARVSKYPINQIWPGYQRPKNQTEIASFAYFDFEGEVEIKIISNKEIKSLEIRPKEYGIKPTIKGNTIEFKLSKPSQFIVEVNGYNNALHIFTNPIEIFKVDKNDPKVHYFGPGMHDAGIIHLNSNETVFIDGGAIVYGVIVSENTSNIKILGRGILDASKIERDSAPMMITLKGVVNADINGIILRDPHLYTVFPTNCNKITINNIKLIGLWRYNSDGVHVENSKDITIRNTFVRGFDDNIVISGSMGAYKEPYNIIENIKVDSCVIWNDWGRALEIGAGTVFDTLKNVSFTNCYIPHFTTAAMDIQDCDRGYIKDVRYEDIYIEEPALDSMTLGTTPLFTNAWGKIIVLGIYGSFYSSDSTRGHIDNIHFDNIRYNDNSIVTYRTEYDSSLILNDKNHFIRDNMYFGNIRYNSINHINFYFSGYDSTHIVSNIHIKDFYLNSNKITDLQFIGENEFVKNIIMN